MNFSLPPYAFLFFGATLLGVIAAILVWTRRSVPGGMWIFGAMVSVAVWNFFCLLEVTSTGLENRILWSKLEYVGANLTTPMLLLFFLSYTQQRITITWRKALLFFIIPLVTFLLVLTNEWHHLHWTGFVPVPGEYENYIYLHGPSFWLSLAYNYLCATGFVLLIVAGLINSTRKYRQQYRALLFSSSFPYVAGIVYSFGFNPYPGLDILPIATSIAGLGIVLTILFLHMFDLIPVARNMLVENMSDMVIVIDQEGRVLDINMAARNFFDCAVKDVTGAPASQVLKQCPNLVESLHSVDKLQEIKLAQRGHEYFYKMQVTPLIDRRGSLQGKMIMMSDITQLYEVNDRLQSQLSEIQSLQAELREQAIRDPLTGLFNRRYLAETLEREFARASREEYPVSLALLDIDHFKKVNDSWGHHAGDLVLKALSDELRAHTRAGDIACRYGGEEFLIVFPNASLSDACQRAEQFRLRIQSLEVPWKDIQIHITVSIGLANFPHHGTTSDMILTAADDALYQAKASGRNCIGVCYNDEPA
jgi:diguanylate cyclase (GGDEF)-like protein/PAS domain S-box-containing protein